MFFFQFFSPSSTRTKLFWTNSRFVVDGLKNCANFYYLAFFLVDEIPPFRGTVFIFQ
jgi:hypothetical protein